MQDTLCLPRESYAALGIQTDAELFLASMGIYLFNRDVLVQLLDNDLADFGKHVIPSAIASRSVYAYVFQGYWEDIGTMRAFFEAHLDLAAEQPRFSFFDMTAPIFTRPRWLPGSKINGGTLDHVMMCDGCIVNDAHIASSVVGIRSIIGSGSKITRAILMGCDYYETMESIQANEAKGLPRVGIGKNARIENAIIDKNARIGDDVVISPEGKPENVDRFLYHVRDGIVIIPKNAVIPSGTII